MGCQGIISFLLRIGIGVQAKELSEALFLSQYEVVYVELFAMEYYNILKAFKGIREGSEAFVVACHEFEHYIRDK